MKKILLTLILAMLMVSGASADIGRNYTGAKVLINSTDTLDDTASGSGLAELTEVFLGIGFASYKNYFGKIVLNASVNAAHGYGLLDSAVIRLFYPTIVGNILIDTVVFATLPCTLSLDTTAINIGGALGFEVYFNDTTSDTNMTAEHLIEWDITVRE